MLDIKSNSISLELFKNVLKTIKEYPDLTPDIIDSFSDNQFKSKSKLLNLLYETHSINHDSEISIFGGWYGSILLPLLSPITKKIIMIDLDDRVIRISKNKFFKKLSNISWSSGDIFTKTLNYSSTTLFINTSCEHMPPMREWPYWKNVKLGTYLAFQSNDMFNIPGHINCVSSLEEFKYQLPENTKILKEDSLTDDRGTRFTIIGQIT